MRDVGSVGVVVRLAKVLEIVLADVGLTMNQFRLMELVAEGSPSTGELSARLVMKPPNVSALTAGLVERDLVRRTRRAVDGRRRDISLTPAGEKLLAAAHSRCTQALRVLEAEHPDGEHLVESLERWVPVLDLEAALLRDATERGVEDPYRYRARDQHPGR